MSAAFSTKHLLQELRELGLAGTIYRVQHEARMRLGLEVLLERGRLPHEGGLPHGAYDDDALMGAWTGRQPWGDPGEIAALRRRIPEERLTALGEQARLAMRGKITCFDRWLADYGHPIDWHLNPVTGRRWDRDAHWSTVLRLQPYVGDVKLTWEVARFPQAYVLARAATFGLGPVDVLAAALDQQIRSFVSNNSFPRGVHWNSGQEVAFRLLAFSFSVGVLSSLGAPLGSLPALVARAGLLMGHHLESNLDFARHAVYNNHLLSEALGLLLASWIAPPCAAKGRWARLAREVLDEQADRQIYRDGAYIQQSHNYHRVAMQDYLVASRLVPEVPAPWRAAMARSLDFLLAHQEPADGRLPNYGANDGAHPLPLSTCDFADFRPTLQALGVAARGERVYEPGPWDESATWLLGARAVEGAPLRPPTRRSVAFRDTGYYVLRGRDPRTFSAFRCGTLRDRFSQIDMLHLDVWWRGHNVLVDPGSYVYNANEAWHAHFMGTESHNTVQVDGHDQMLHYRQFKVLYWTEAELLDFADHPAFALVAGEHSGFRRHPGGCVHRRAVLLVKDDLVVVVDRVSGSGRHRVRLHWLGGEFPFQDAPAQGRMTLTTPDGPFTVSVLDERGAPLPGSVVAGQESPPRGWLSRHYGERAPVPSLAVERFGAVPMTTVSVLAAGVPEIAVEGGRWSVRAAGLSCGFRLEGGMIHPEHPRPSSP